MSDDFRVGASGQSWAQLATSEDVARTPCRKIHEIFFEMVLRSSSSEDDDFLSDLALPDDLFASAMHEDSN